MAMKAAQQEAPPPPTRRMTFRSVSWFSPKIILLLSLCTLFFLMPSRNTEITNPSSALLRHMDSSDRQGGSVSQESTSVPQSERADGRVQPISETLDQVSSHRNNRQHHRGLNLQPKILKSETASHKTGLVTVKRNSATPGISAGRSWGQGEVGQSVNRYRMWRKMRVWRAQGTSLKETSVQLVLHRDQAQNTQDHQNGVNSLEIQNSGQRAQGWNRHYFLFRRIHGIKKAQINRNRLFPRSRNAYSYSHRVSGYWPVNGRIKNRRNQLTKSLQQWNGLARHMTGLAGLRKFYTQRRQLNLRATENSISIKKSLGQLQPALRSRVWQRLILSLPNDQKKIHPKEGVHLLSLVVNLKLMLPPHHHLPRLLRIHLRSVLKPETRALYPTGHVSHFLFFRPVRREERRDQHNMFHERRKVKGIPRFAVVLKRRMQAYVEWLRRNIRLMKVARIYASRNAANNARLWHNFLLQYKMLEKELHPHSLPRWSSLFNWKNTTVSLRSPLGKVPSNFFKGEHLNPFGSKPPDIAQQSYHAIRLGHGQNDTDFSSRQSILSLQQQQQQWQRPWRQPQQNDFLADFENIQNLLSKSNVTLQSRMSEQERLLKKLYASLNVIIRQNSWLRFRLESRLDKLYTLLSIVQKHTLDLLSSWLRVLSPAGRGESLRNQRNPLYTKGFLMVKSIKVTFNKKMVLSNMLIDSIKNVAHRVWELVNGWWVRIKAWILMMLFNSAIFNLPHLQVPRTRYTSDWSVINNRGSVFAAIQRKNSTDKTKGLSATHLTNLEWSETETGKLEKYIQQKNSTLSINEKSGFTNVNTLSLRDMSMSKAANKRLRKLKRSVSQFKKTVAEVVPHKFQQLDMTDSGRKVILKEMLVRTMKAFAVPAGGALRLHKIMNKAVKQRKKRGPASLPAINNKLTDVISGENDNDLSSTEVSEADLDSPGLRFPNVAKHHQSSDDLEGHRHPESVENANQIPQQLNSPEGQETMKTWVSPWLKTPHVLSRVMLKLSQVPQRLIAFIRRLEMANLRLRMNIFSRLFNERGGKLVQGASREAKSLHDIFRLKPPESTVDESEQEQRENTDIRNVQGESYLPQSTTDKQSRHASQHAVPDEINKTSVRRARILDEFPDIAYVIKYKTSQENTETATGSTPRTQVRVSAKVVNSEVKMKQRMKFFYDEKNKVEGTKMANQEESSQSAQEKQHELTKREVSNVDDVVRSDHEYFQNDNEPFEKFLRQQGRPVQDFFSKQDPYGDHFENKGGDGDSDGGGDGHLTSDRSAIMSNGDEGVSASESQAKQQRLKSEVEELKDFMSNRNLETKEAPKLKSDTQPHIPYTLENSPNLLDKSEAKTSVGDTADSLRSKLLSLLKLVRDSRRKNNHDRVQNSKYVNFAHVNSNAMSNIPNQGQINSNSEITVPTPRGDYPDAESGLDRPDELEEDMRREEERTDDSRQVHPEEKEDRNQDDQNQLSIATLPINETSLSDTEADQMKKSPYDIQRDPSTGKNVRPTEADIKLLKNIEMLTYKVLGKYGEKAARSNTNVSRDDQIKFGKFGNIKRDNLDPEGDKYTEGRQQLLHQDTDNGEDGLENEEEERLSSSSLPDYAQRDRHELSIKPIIFTDSDTKGDNVFDHEAAELSEINKAETDYRKRMKREIDYDTDLDEDMTVKADLLNDLRIKWRKARKDIKKLQARIGAAKDEYSDIEANLARLLRRGDALAETDLRLTSSNKLENTMKKANWKVAQAEFSNFKKEILRQQKLYEKTQKISSAKKMGKKLTNIVDSLRSEKNQLEGEIGFLLDAIKTNQSKVKNKDVIPGAGYMSNAMANDMGEDDYDMENGFEQTANEFDALVGYKSYLPPDADLRKVDGMLQTVLSRERSERELDKALASRTKRSKDDKDEKIRGKREGGEKDKEDFDAVRFNWQLPFANSFDNGNREKFPYLGEILERKTAKDFPAKWQELRKDAFHLQKRLSAVIQRYSELDAQLNKFIAKKGRSLGKKIAVLLGTNFTGGKLNQAQWEIARRDFELFREKVKRFKAVAERSELSIIMQNIKNGIERIRDALDYQENILHGKLNAKVEPNESFPFGTRPRTKIIAASFVPQENQNVRDNNLGKDALHEEHLDYDNPETVADGIHALNKFEDDLYTNTDLEGVDNMLHNLLVKTALAHFETGEKEENTSNSTNHNLKLLSRQKRRGFGGRRGGGRRYWRMPPVPEPPRFRGMENPFEEFPPPAYRRGMEMPSGGENYDEASLWQGGPYYQRSSAFGATDYRAIDSGDRGSQERWGDGGNEYPSRRKRQAFRDKGGEQNSDRYWNRHSGTDPPSLLGLDEPPVDQMGESSDRKETAYRGRFKDSKPKSDELDFLWSDDFDIPQLRGFASADKDVADGIHDVEFGNGENEVFLRKAKNDKKKTQELEESQFREPERTSASKGHKKSSFKEPKRTYISKNRKESKFREPDSTSANEPERTFVGKKRKESKFKEPDSTTANQKRAESNFKEPKKFSVGKNRKESKFKEHDRTPANEGREESVIKEPDSSSANQKRRKSKIFAEDQRSGKAQPSGITSSRRKDLSSGKTSKDSDFNSGYGVDKRRLDFSGYKSPPSVEDQINDIDGKYWSDALTDSLNTLQSVKNLEDARLYLDKQKRLRGESRRTSGLDALMEPFGTSGDVDDERKRMELKRKVVHAMLNNSKGMEYLPDTYPYPPSLVDNEAIDNEIRQVELDRTGQDGSTYVDVDDGNKDGLDVLDDIIDENTDEFLKGNASSPTVGKKGYLDTTEVDKFYKELRKAEKLLSMEIEQERQGEEKALMDEIKRQEEQERLQRTRDLKDLKWSAKKEAESLADLEKLNNQIAKKKLKEYKQEVKELAKVLKEQKKEQERRRKAWMKEMEMLRKYH